MDVLRSAIRAVGRTITHNATLKHVVRGEPRGGFDLAGEKQLDWAWVIEKSRATSGRALDVGCGDSVIPAALHLAGFQTTAMDLAPRQPYGMPGFRVLSGDFLTYDFGDEQFELISLCSAIEHFGLIGKNATAEENDEDLAGMRKARRLLAGEGRLLLTVPLGLDYVLRPWHRVYGAERLPLLLDGYQVLERKNLRRSAPGGNWVQCTDEEALSHPRTPQRYALGEFVLSPA
jgi:SAM-dependent methyltransferase